MKFKNILNDLGISYNEVKTRYSDMTDFYRQCLIKFLEDKNFEKLELAVSQKNYGAIEMTAHTLKGLSASLLLSRLCEHSTKIVDFVRAGMFEKIQGVFIVLKEEYFRVVEILSKLK